MLPAANVSEGEGNQKNLERASANLSHTDFRKACSGARFINISTKDLEQANTLV